ncbi:MAG TPA: Gfo/Idh/MocA family oxidoreductase [Virgibacillus sp.]|nr:Gfo/Idh/MocA family oxidoreductase [Virgibacillus sp.]
MIKFGIIGMGLRGRMFADTIAQNPYAEVAAICDLNQTNLNENKENYGIKGYIDFEKMISETKLDGIIVTTPDYLHKSPVIKAAEKGIHIMVEKPFTTNINDALEMHQAIKTSKVKCLVAFENRWTSPFVEAKNAINNGDLGDIITMNSRLNDTIAVPTKMLKWSKDSSPGWFLLPHTVDMACWLSDKKPIKVFGVGTKRVLVAKGINTFDSIQAVVTFDDHTNASFTTSWVLPESMPQTVDYKYEIIGENGALYVDTHDQMVHKASNKYQHVPTIGTPINGKLRAAPSYMLDAFIDNIRLNTEPIAGSEEALLNTKVVAAIHQSIETGEPVYI